MDISFLSFHSAKRSILNHMPSGTPSILSEVKLVPKKKRNQRFTEGEKNKVYLFCFVLSWCALDFLNNTEISPFLHLGKQHISFKCEIL
jgi:hypothetical protein